MVSPGRTWPVGSARFWFTKQSWLLTCSFDSTGYQRNFRRDRADRQMMKRKEKREKESDSKCDQKRSCVGMKKQSGFPKRTESWQRKIRRGCRFCMLQTSRKTGEQATRNVTDVRELPGREACIGISMTYKKDPVQRRCRMEYFFSHGAAGGYDFSLSNGPIPALQGRVSRAVRIRQAVRERTGRSASR